MLKKANCSKGATTFSKSLHEAIKSSETIILSIDKKISTVNESGEPVFESVAEGGGGRTSIHHGFIYLAITGENCTQEIEMEDGKFMIYKPADIFIHEFMGHAIPYLKREDGSAIEKENVVRKELHLKLRKETGNDPCHCTPYN